MVVAFCYSAEALEDLENLRRDPERKRDADDIEAFLQEVECSDEALEVLTRNYEKRGYPHPQPRFDVKKISCFHEQGFKINRLASQRLEWTKRKYRIIYAHDTELNECVVLAIAKRKIVRGGPIDKEFVIVHPATEAGTNEGMSPLPQCA